MGLYSRFVLPRVVHLACRSGSNMNQRAKVVPRARGCVLEVGIGSGLNLPFYDASRVTKVWGLDPSPELRAMAARVARDVPIDVEFLGLPGEAVPLEAASVDTVVITYTLCSVVDPEAALRQMARVLKPGGELLFCEHGEAPDERVRRWQRRLTPVWSRLGGGCHLGRPIPALIERGGFRLTGVESRYLPGWRPASFTYWGAATRA
jgi:ubiquinone/menaquinone biosynthesis C-methylase UbiE